MPRIALVRQHGVEVLLSACFFVDVNGVGTVGIDRRYEEKRRGQGKDSMHASGIRYLICVGGDLVSAGKSSDELCVCRF